jgi:hypothetical protein
MPIHSRMLRLSCSRSGACPELVEGLSMSGRVPLALSVAQRSRRVIQWVVLIEKPSYSDVSRSLGLLSRYQYPEGRAMPDLAFYRDCTAQKLQELPHDIEP